MLPFFLPMNTFEFLLLKLGASFTVAKFLPFLALIVAGIFFSWVLFRLPLLQFFPRFLKRICALILIISLPALYFVFYPIYQGDVFEMGYAPSTKMKFNFQEELVVVALPGCKFCAASTESMKEVKPYLTCNIRYWVLGSDTLDVLAYKKLLRKDMACEFAPKQKELLPITRGSFPTYLWIKNKKLVKAWHNDGFGIKALSEISK